MKDILTNDSSVNVREIRDVVWKLENPSIPGKG